MMSKCACGGNMVKVWDTEQDLPRVKCDNPMHSPARRWEGEDDPLIQLLKTPGAFVMDMTDPEGIR
jgi:hypothetical protein